MTTSTRTRRGNQDGSEPRQRKDGRWQANYPIGQRPDGSTILKSVYGKTKADCRAKVRKLAQEVAAGNMPAGRSPKLIEWLDYWLINIAPATAKSPQSRRGYKNKIDNHVRGHRVASKRLTALTPGDIEAIYATMRAPQPHVSGQPRPAVSESSVAGLHRVLRRALNVAVKRGFLGKNPLLLLDSPTGGDFEPQVYTTEEVRRMIQAAQSRDDEARWLLNLMLGPRQGEALGLTWPDVDFKSNKLRIERELFTLPWAHGCLPDAGGEPTCGRSKGVHCPDRHGGGYFTGPPKSSAGVRSVTMPTPLRNALLRHAQTQQTVRKHEPWEPWVDQDGVERDLVFCRPGGLPMYPKADWSAWRSLLAEAKVPAGRPHDGRHTAATTLLLLGVDQRVVMEILGWSQISMLQRYQHVLDEMHQDVADKLTDHWAPEAAEPVSNVVSLADRLAHRRALKN